MLVTPSVDEFDTEYKEPCNTMIDVFGMGGPETISTYDMVAVAV